MTIVSAADSRFSFISIRFLLCVSATPRRSWSFARVNAACCCYSSYANGWRMEWRRASISSSMRCDVGRDAMRAGSLLFALQLFRACLCLHLAPTRAPKNRRPEDESLPLSRADTARPACAELRLLCASRGSLSVSDWQGCLHGAGDVRLCFATRSAAVKRLTGCEIK